MIDLATGVALTGTVEDSVTNGAGGKIVATGSGSVVDRNRGRLQRGRGTTSGTKPVVVWRRRADLLRRGASSIAQLGESSTLSGNIGSGQSLLLESTSSENVESTASASFMNAGRSR